MANDFGKNLKIMRKLNNITQSEMARKVNASRSCISNYESGKRQPDAETINFIADFFDVSIDYLMGRSSVKLSVKNEKVLEELQNLNRKANAIKVFDEVLKPLGKRPLGIRIDSGDITYISKKARKMLDDAGYEDCKICVSKYFRYY